MDFMKSYITQRNPRLTIETFVSHDLPSILVYAGPTRPPKFSILLNGHLDVVPGKAKQFAARVEEDKLYGRGALDMKSTLLAMTDVFCDVAEQAPIGLQIVCDEETGGADGTGLQLANGVMCDMALVGEATPRDAICTESRGFCRATITFNGTSAHGAYPWLGENAVLAATRYINDLLTTYPTPDNEMWQTTVNIAGIQTPGTTFNRVPDTAVLQLELRFTPQDPQFMSQTAAQNFLKSLDSRSKVTIHAFEPSHTANVLNPLVQRLAQIIAEHTGVPTQFIKKYGSADVRYFTERGIDAVTYGLTGANIHADNEYVELASLETYKTILKQFLQK